MGDDRGMAKQILILVLVVSIGLYAGATFVRQLQAPKRTLVDPIVLETNEDERKERSKERGGGEDGG